MDEFLQKYGELGREVLGYYKFPYAIEMMEKHYEGEWNSLEEWEEFYEGEERNQFHIKLKGKVHIFALD